MRICGEFSLRSNGRLFTLITNLFGKPIKSLSSALLYFTLRVDSCESQLGEWVVKRQINIACWSLRKSPENAEKARKGEKSESIEFISICNLYLNSSNKQLIKMLNLFLFPSRRRRLLHIFNFFIASNTQRSKSAYNRTLLWVFCLSNKRREKCFLLGEGEKMKKRISLRL